MVGSFSAPVRTSAASVSVFAWRYSWLLVADVVRTGERGSAFCIRWLAESLGRTMFDVSMALPKTVTFAPFAVPLSKLL